MADQPDWTTSVTSRATAQTLIKRTFAGGGSFTYTVPVDLSTWASVYIVAGAGAVQTRLDYAWYDSTGTQVLGGGSVILDVSGVGTEFQLRVLGPTLVLTFNNSSANPSPYVTVIGSNVPIAADTFPNGGVSIINLNTTWVVGTPQVVGSYTSNGKLTNAVLAVGGAATKGYWGFYFYTAALVRTFMVFTDTGLAHTDAGGSNTINTTAYLPVGNLEIVFYPETAGTYNVQASLTATV